jgi:hypothetical protein
MDDRHLSNIRKLQRKKKVVCEVFPFFLGGGGCARGACLLACLLSVGGGRGASIVGSDGEVCNAVVWCCEGQESGVLVVLVD